MKVISILIAISSPLFLLNCTTIRTEVIEGYMIDVWNRQEANSYFPHAGYIGATSYLILNSDTFNVFPASYLMSYSKYSVNCKDRRIENFYMKNYRNFIYGITCLGNYYIDKDSVKIYKLNKVKVNVLILNDHCSQFTYSDSRFEICEIIKEPPFYYATNFINQDTLTSIEIQKLGLTRIDTFETLRCF